MASEATAGRPGPTLSTTRLEAFSDGVFAIAITLLVLDLAIGPTGPALDRVLDAWPAYLAYLVSFSTVGAAWMGHSMVTDRLARADLGLLRINLVVLLVVSVVPFPTALVADGLSSESDERVFVTLYGVVLLAMRAALFCLDEYSRRRGLLVPGAVEDDEVRRGLLPTVVGYLVAIAIGLALPTVAVVLYCAIGILLMFPFRELGALFRRP